MSDQPTTPEETIKEIEAIYDEAAQKLRALGEKRKSIDDAYIRELETRKIAHLRESLGLPVLPTNNQ